MSPPAEIVPVTLKSPGIIKSSVICSDYPEREPVAVILDSELISPSAETMPYTVMSPNAVMSSSVIIVP